MSGRKHRLLHSPFRPYGSFGKDEQLERRDLVLGLAQKIWDPARLEEFRAPS